MQPPYHFRRKRFRFLSVPLRKPAIVRAVHLNEFHFRIERVRRREGAKAVVVIHVVRKRDQRFVLAAIVPDKVPLAHAESKAIVKHAFEIFVFEIVFINVRRIEKFRGRQLLRIAHDHRRFRARDRAHRFRRGHLRSFVENHEIKRVCLGREILRHRGGTH